MTPTSSAPIFDWDKLRVAEERLSPAENELIVRHFNQWLSGNDGWETANAPEIRALLYMFRHAWLLAHLWRDNSG